ncbi:MAG: HEAT repeat domain-containing protein [Rubrobacteraceae bacterium]|nr:HEAT repeat domain-containing protein [Rubrobacteraceae bacterium]
MKSRIGDVGRLVERLRSCELAEVDELARAFESLGVTEVPEGIEELARSGDYTRRYASAVCGGAIGDGRFLGDLLVLASDEVGLVRRAAARSLGRLGDRGAVPALVFLARDRDPQVRAEAARSLGGLGAGERVLRELVRDRSWSVRRVALWALAEVAGERAAGVLEEALEDPEPRVREAVVPLLVRVHHLEPVFEALACDPSTDVRRVAAESLARSKAHRAAPPLFEALCREGPGLRPYALRALHEILGEGAGAFLAGLLRSPQAEERRAAVDALAWLGAREQAPELLPLLEDPDPEVRFAAVRALGDLEAREGLLPLYALLRGEDPGLRNAAARALSKVPGAFALLREAAEDPRPEVAQAALGALATRGRADAR